VSYTLRAYFSQSEAIAFERDIQIRKEFPETWTFYNAKEYELSQVNLLNGLFKCCLLGLSIFV